MDIKSLFKKYIIPHEIDFVKMLQDQSLATFNTVDDLYKCFIEKNEKSCKKITKDENRTKHLKDKNMNTLLNAFITPIDRESIYRAITQLDWINIAIKHFVEEAKAYKIDNLNEYKKIFSFIYEASKSLNEGFEALSSANSAKVSRISDKTRDLTDKISEEYIKEMVKLSKDQDFQKVFIYKEVLSQLKEIGKRIHVSANTLQDIVVKMD